MKIYTVLAVDDDTAQPYGVKSFKEEKDADTYAIALAHKVANDYVMHSLNNSSDIDIDVDTEMGVIDISIDEDENIAFVFTYENDLN